MFEIMCEEKGFTTVFKDQENAMQFKGYLCINNILGNYTLWTATSDHC